MPVNRMQTREWYQAAGDGFLVRTSDFNMVPGNIFVTASLSLVLDGAAQAAGIASATSTQAGEGKLRQLLGLARSTFPARPDEVNGGHCHQPQSFG